VRPCIDAVRVPWYTMIKQQAKARPGGVHAQHNANAGLTILNPNSSGTSGTDKSRIRGCSRYRMERVIRCHLIQETRFQMCVEDVVGKGPGTYCSPRHGMPIQSRNKGMNAFR
jgi:hypothetical protein